MKFMIRKFLYVVFFIFVCCVVIRRRSYKSRYTLKSTNDSFNIKIGSSSRNLSYSIQYLTL